ncbi:MAG: SWIM zinc finger family protein, partial [Planctomycetota bacterium]
MSLTLATVEALAPDQASLNAAKKLLRRAKWPVLGEDDAFAWGLCQGSGSNPYQTAFDLRDHGYKCTCPSRKFPCKHVLALAWLRVEDAEAFVPDSRPQWVTEWDGRRRKRKPAEADSLEGQAETVPKSISEAAAAPAAPVESAEEARKRSERAAKQRERNRAKREELIATGLLELESWIDEVVARGAVSAVSGLAERAAPIVRRLTDAKAPALATRVDSIAERLFELEGSERPASLVAELGDLALIAAAYTCQSELPTALVDDVRREIGWVLDSEALRARQDAPRTQGEFEVVQKRSLVQADGLRRFETWLQRVDADAEEPLCTAVLLDYVPVRSGAAPVGGWGLGDAVKGELVYYPSVAPLRARFEGEGPAVRAEENPTPRFQAGLAENLRRLRTRASLLPWLRTDSIAVDGVRLRRAESDGALWLTDGTEALPLSGPFDELDVLEGFDLEGVFG